MSIEPRVDITTLTDGELIAKCQLWQSSRIERGLESFHLYKIIAQDGTKVSLLSPRAHVSTEPRENYIVDIADFTCDCKDFTGRCMQVNIELSTREIDMAIGCKHLTIVSSLLTAAQEAKAIAAKEAEKARHQAQRGGYVKGQYASHFAAQRARREEHLQRLARVAATKPSKQATLAQAFAVEKSINLLVASGRVTQEQLDRDFGA
jgi:hypothetical protein